MAMIFLTSTIGVFCWAPNFKYIFDDNGITIEHKIQVLSFIIFKKSSTISWYSIQKIDYWGITIGFVFGYAQKGFIRCILMNPNLFFKNGEIALEYIAKKLPAYRFTKDAQKKLFKMGIVL